MSNDISIMKELQYLWTNVLARGKEIERSVNSKRIYAEKLDNSRKLLQNMETGHRNLKIEIKNAELKLAETEGKLSKLDGQFAMLRTEREIEAHNHEVSELKDLMDDIETDLIDKMEESDRFDGEIETAKRECDELEKQVFSDLKLLDDKIQSLEKEKSGFEIKFDEKSAELSPSVSSRFLKLIKSKDGVAIAEVNGEICGHCNFQLPSTVVSAAKKNEIVNCTNCGRYIYFIQG